MWMNSFSRISVKLSNNNCLINIYRDLHNFSGGFRIFPRWGRQLSGKGGGQNTILPKFPKNCMKLKELDPPLNSHWDQIHCDQMLHKIRCVKTDPGLTREETFRGNHDSTLVKPVKEKLRTTVNQLSWLSHNKFLNRLLIWTGVTNVHRSTSDVFGPPLYSLTLALALHRSTCQVKWGSHHGTQVIGCLV